MDCKRKTDDNINKVPVSYYTMLLISDCYHFFTILSHINNGTYTMFYFVTASASNPASASRPASRPKYPASASRPKSPASASASASRVLASLTSLLYFRNQISQMSVIDIYIQYIRTILLLLIIKLATFVTVRRI